VTSRCEEIQRAGLGGWEIHYLVTDIDAKTDGDTSSSLERRKRRHQHPAYLAPLSLDVDDQIVGPIEATLSGEVPIQSFEKGEGNDEG
jgi:hypothetical protein